MGKRRNYTKNEYFEFLLDLGFGSDKYWDLAKELHNLDYIWHDRMDENRMYDGIEIRKYYLSDDLGYMPDEIDEYDEYIFPSSPSVLEVLVGFSNRLCRDILGWEVKKLVKLWMKNLEIYSVNCDREFVRESVREWLNGEICIFGEKSQESTDLWSQAALWMQNL